MLNQILDDWVPIWDTSICETNPNQVLLKVILMFHWIVHRLGGTVLLFHSGATRLMTSTKFFKMKPKVGFSSGCRELKHEQIPVDQRLAWINRKMIQKFCIREDSIGPTWVDISPAADRKRFLTNFYVVNNLLVVLSICFQNYIGCFSKTNKTHGWDNLKPPAQ